jgi:SAM-dependent methyltransferase
MKPATPVANGSNELADRTVADFGEQWGRYTDNSGWYGSLELFRDIFGPLLDLEEIRGCRVADIGSGTGRIVHMLLEAGAAHVTALEPSEAFPVLEANLRRFGDRVGCLRRRGDEIPSDGGFDAVFSIGVLHHVPDPSPVVEAALRSLRPGGLMGIWVYGREGNRLYLALVEPLRAVTTRLPHAILGVIAWALTLALGAYVAACRFLPLPLRSYMRQVIARLPMEKRYLVVYDQLNPAHARYYTRDEARELLIGVGFVDVAIYHRHGYSWAVVGRKPRASSIEVGRGGGDTRR